MTLMGGGVAPARIVSPWFIAVRILPTTRAVRKAFLGVPSPNSKSLIVGSCICLTGSGNKCLSQEVYSPKRLIDYNLVRTAFRRALPRQRSRRRLASMAEESTIIRPAVEAEARSIRSLVRRAYAVYMGRMGREPGPMLDDYKKRVADGAAWVLERDGGIAGVLVLLSYDDHLLMDNVAVDPKCQGRGVGKALIAFAEAEARRRGYGEIRLYTHETMVENIAMYASLGYEETGRGKQAGYDRVFMRKKLA